MKSYFELENIEFLLYLIVLNLSHEKLIQSVEAIRITFFQYTSSKLK